MRLGRMRVLAGCLVAGGSLGWGLAGGPGGIPAASALTAAPAVTGSQCEPLAAAASASASPSASPSSSSGAELCVSVQASQSGIEAGQAASYTVQVSTENGAAAGVSVTLSAAPQGQQAGFTSLCPSGNGTATCTIGSLGSAAAPAVYQLQAQIPVASTATSVTSVTLTATADASPAMTTAPAAAAAVTVSAPAASPSTTTSATATAAAAAAPSATARAAATAAATARAAAARAAATLAPVTPAIRTSLAAAVPLGAMPATSGAGTSLTSPVSISSALPVITPGASPAADVATRAPDDFTLSMSAATAQLLGLIVFGLVLVLAAAKLARDQLPGRRARKDEAGPAAGEGEGTARKRSWLPRPGTLAALCFWRAAPRHGRHRGSQAQSGAGAPPPALESRRLIRGEVIRDHRKPVAAGPHDLGRSQHGEDVTATLAVNYQGMGPEASK